MTLALAAFCKGVGGGDGNSGDKQLHAKAKAAAVKHGIDFAWFQKTCAVLADSLERRLMAGGDTLTLFE